MAVEECGCICKRKFTNDMVMVRHMKRVADNGDIIVLYPEARYSFVELMLSFLTPWENCQAAKDSGCDINNAWTSCKCPLNNKNRKVKGLRL